MARTTQITFGQIAQIADQMKAAGTRPTARAVRERIGSGSMGTIHKLLQQWNGKASADADEENEGAELPAHIQNSLMDFIGTEIATACEPINEELQAAKEAAEAIAEENIRLEGRIDQITRQHDETQNNYASLKGTIAELRNETAEAKTQWKNLQAANTELLRELDKAQRQIEMLASYAELSQTKAALAESERFRINAEKEVAVVHAQLAAEIEKTADLKQRAGDAEAKASARSEELKQANNHYQACAARLEAAAREIESLRKPKATPTPKTAKKPTVKTNANS